jgi:hypothetical protein
MDKPFQRKGAKSNTAVGAEFESIARDHFATTGLTLSPKFSVAIGVRGTKTHNFDLGCSDPKKKKFQEPLRSLGITKPCTGVADRCRIFKSTSLAATR